jgi:quercetin dioxygenase-like cupin family protein
MNRPHECMRNLLSNLVPPQLLHFPHRSEQPSDGSNQTRRLTMNLRRCGSQPSTKGPAEYFTGNVRIDPLFEAPDPARARAASVTFEPGARTAWHTHPLGQNLIVTSGCGWVQTEGAPKEEIRPGGRGLVPAAGKALAWRHADHGHDPYCHPGTARRQSCRVAGESQRRAIPSRIKR